MVSIIFFLSDSYDSECMLMHANCCPFGILDGAITRSLQRWGESKAKLSFSGLI